MPMLYVGWPYDPTARAGGIEILNLVRGWVVEGEKRGTGGTDRQQQTKHYGNSKNSHL